MAFEHDDLFTRKSSARQATGFFAKLAASVLMVWSAMATPAPAHSASGSPSTNYVTTINSVQPSASGFTVKSIEQGSRLEVRWKQGDPIVIAGYEGEPYLRIGPDGVDENRLSPAAYINRDRLGKTAPPADVDAEAAPAWKTVSGRPLARFHDHRAHYMGSVRPESVDANPGARQTIQQFDVPISQGEQSYLVVGVVEWVPNKSPALYLVVAVALFGALVATALWAGRSVVRGKAIRPLIVGALSALVVTDVVHLIGIAGGVAGGSLLGRAITIGYASIAAWLIAGVSALLWLRGRPDALYLTTFAAGLITLVGGVADLSVLSKPSVVFLWSSSLARWCVAATLGLGLGLVVAAILLTRPNPQDESDLEHNLVVGGETVAD